ncbi:MAG: methyltransferase domain-containing protein [Deltaproteobacteria bacterium]|nr:methyltransferase domain-containing protein [Deltaproteobacteria bacterium]
MKIDYSKSLDDIAPEKMSRLAPGVEKYLNQVNTARYLLNLPQRKICVLCGRGLDDGARFTHRSLPFIRCRYCSHIQSLGHPPDDYPRCISSDHEFRHVYQRLSQEAYEDRKKRVYRPKLTWIQDSLHEKGYRDESLRSAAWVEFGCGAGYFISCLHEEGMRNCQGLDADQHLVEIGQSFTPNGIFHHYTGTLTEALSEYPAEIYTAFFVLEHIHDLHDFFLQLGSLPAGTIFIFSVPVFGLSCLLENVFEKHYARNLDGVFHTQIFTDESIAYGLKVANFSMVAKWIFGQDAEDFHRFLYQNLIEKYPSELFELVNKQLAALQNPLQSILDKNGLSDQRHIIAIKN